jgi:hypothetical protein
LEFCDISVLAIPENPQAVRITVDKIDTVININQRLSPLNSKVRLFYLWAVVIVILFALRLFKTICHRVSFTEAIGRFLHNANITLALFCFG